MKTLFLLSSLIASCLLKSQEVHIETLKPGSPAPDFNLPATDGRNYTLGDFSDFSVLVVLFTCNHCPTAQAYEERIINIVREYRPKGVGFMAISPNDPNAVSLSELGYSDLGDSMEEMKMRVGQAGYNFPYLYDGETQQTSIAYGPVATPHVFVFNAQRLLQYSGRIDDTEDPYVPPKTTDLRNALDVLLNKQQVSNPVTKTFGCSIKWSWKDEWITKQREEWAAEPVSLEELDLNGVRQLISNPTDNLILVNIWATWCGPCIIEFPSFVDIHRMYRGRDFEFISITTDKLSQKGKALDKLKKFQASSRNYIYTGEDIYALIEDVDPKWQGALPYTLLIEPGGKVLERYPGIITPLDVKRRIVGYLGRYYADNK